MAPCLQTVTKQALCKWGLFQGAKSILKLLLSSWCLIKRFTSFNATTVLRCETWVYLNTKTRCFLLFFVTFKIVSPVCVMSGPSDHCLLWLYSSSSYIVPIYYSMKIRYIHTTYYKASALWKGGAVKKSINWIERMNKHASIWLHQNLKGEF